VKTILAATSAFLLVLLISWLSTHAVNSDAERQDQVLSELDRFSMIDAALHRDVLAARIGILRNYDPLVAETNKLYDSLDKLRSITPANQRSTAAIDRLARSIKSQEALVERFKTDNSLLQNSIAYLSEISDRVGQPNWGPEAQQVDELAVSLLRLALDTTVDTASQVQTEIDALAHQTKPPLDAEATHALLTHARLLHELLPETDSLVKSLTIAPEKRDRNALRALIVSEKKSSLANARSFRLLLYPTSLLLIGLLIYLALELRSRARALYRRAALERVLATVSRRFIDSEVQEIDARITQALEDVARCVGADRAYFIYSGTSQVTHTWSRPGVNFPNGWPGQASELLERLCPATESVFCVSQADRLAHKADRDACMAYGLKGWACATNANARGIDAMLGFDTVYRPCSITRFGQLSLLSVGLETFVNASRRHCAEGERARLEQRLQRARRMETLGTFASGIAHNFNNIIGAMLGYVEITEERMATSGANIARNLAEIRRAGERARDLVDQILAFGRQRESSREHVNVSALLVEVASLLKASQPASIDVAINDSSHLTFVSAGPAELQQVIFNVCTNAAKAMDGVGRIEIDMKAIEVNSLRVLSHGALMPGRYSCISVSDAGCGMDEVILERIFEPFFTTRADGNGLGLATAYEVVREYGGTINVESVEGKGSRFDIWLPRVSVPEPAQSIEISRPPLGSGETVLVVDDHQEELLRTEEILAALGYEPIGLKSADHILVSDVALSQFDAFLVGHLRRERNSIELAASLHRLAPLTPILMATSSIHDISAQTLISVGVSEVVARPILASDIAAALRRCCAPQPLSARAN
jgi:signal transduction histidine kinase/CheY-like chemotaxis protein